jgi:hypothetical protein
MRELSKGGRMAGLASGSPARSYPYFMPGRIPWTKSSFAFDMRGNPLWKMPESTKNAHVRPRELRDFSWVVAVSRCVLY